MEIGLIFPQMEFPQDVTAVKDYAQSAEELGFSHISAYEHIVGANPDRPGWNGPLDYRAPFHEPFVMFGFMAGVTQKIGFLTRVVILPQRQTALVAKQAASLDILCEGKLRLGVGIGWNEVEYIAQGESFRNRAARFEEQIDLLRKLWKEPLLNYEGRYHTIPDAGINPLPLQKPIPIWLGGHSDATLRRVARIGDGWLPNDLPQDETIAAIKKLKAYCEEHGRASDEIGIDVRIPYSREQSTDWQKEIQLWKDANVSHLSLDTMGCGFQNYGEHLEALNEFARAVGLLP